jgi:hypothetical protein
MCAHSTHIHNFLKKKLKHQSLIEENTSSVTDPNTRTLGFDGKTVDLMLEQ